MAEQIPSVQINGFKARVNISTWLITTLITVVVGYGSVTLTIGSKLQEVREIKRQVEENRKQIEVLKLSSLQSKDLIDLQRQMDTQTKTLERMEINIDNLRNRR